jgi:hypothetical protein
MNTEINKDLDLTVNTILGWIKSCLLQDQLWICKNAVLELVHFKFSKSVDYFTLERAKEVLQSAIDDRHLQLAGISEDERNNLLIEYSLQFKSEPITH